VCHVPEGLPLSVPQPSLSWWGWNGDRQTDSPASAQSRDANGRSRRPLLLRRDAGWNCPISHGSLKEKASAVFTTEGPRGEREIQGKPSRLRAGGLEGKRGGTSRGREVHHGMSHDIRGFVECQQIKTLPPATKSGRSCRPCRCGSWTRCGPGRRPACPCTQPEAFRGWHRSQGSSDRRGRCCRLT
jgi:hypothetical protein